MADEILGVRCFKSMEDARATVKQVDLFVCGVAAKAAHEMLSSIIDTGYAHTSFILSAGFGETEQGKVLEKDLRDKLAQKQSQFPDNSLYPLFNGANTLGYLWQSRVNTVFVDSRKSSSYDNENNFITCKQKNVALLCQSGAFMISRLSDLSRKVSPLVSVSVGNQIDMSNVDFLEWLLEDNSAQKFFEAFGERCEALE